MDKPPFTALSYCWGKEVTKCGEALGDQDQPRIQLGDKTLRLTENLHDALLALRNENLSRLWIDQICIDQGNTQERTLQVAMMSTIYKQAQSVRVWLGNAENGSDEAIDFLTKLASQEGYISPELRAQLDSRSPMSIKLHDLLSRPWFGRVWTLQEAALAQHCIAQCGPTQIPFEVLERFNRNCQLSTRFARAMDRGPELDCYRKRRGSATAKAIRDLACQ